MNIQTSKKTTKDDLVDINDIIIDPLLDKEKRIQSFVEQIKNPLCYKCGKYIVNITFDENTNRTIGDCFEEFLRNL